MLFIKNTQKVLDTYYFICYNLTIKSKGEIKMKLEAFKNLLTKNMKKEFENLYQLDNFITENFSDYEVSSIFDNGVDIEELVDSGVIYWIGWNPVENERMLFRVEFNKKHDILVLKSIEYEGC